MASNTPGHVRLRASPAKNRTRGALAKQTPIPGQRSFAISSIGANRANSWRVSSPVPHPSSRILGPST